MQSEVWFRFVVWGDSLVGKSSICCHFITGESLDMDKPKFDDEVYNRQIYVSGVLCYVEFLDARSGFEYSPVTDARARPADGFVIVYSVTDRKSFDATAAYFARVLAMKDLPQVPMVLVGNKCDLHNVRQVSPEEGAELAQQFSASFLETSTIEHINIENVFTECIKQVVLGRPDMYRYRFPDLCQPSKKSSKKCLIS
uniref:Uncharacterized protein n=1 Tax=Vannella robusta TaxID=1487602 RepID=A0A7S4IIG6_9EUKA|mmetsp:Transcript_3009/g.3715  ORF Transcript_3009/g.3715 Transcript_3009/m.3715 type:complete len:198 (+) Transcript_3009:1-594(+)